MIDKFRSFFPSLITLTSLFLGFYSIVIAVHVMKIPYVINDKDIQQLFVEYYLNLIGVFIIVSSILDYFDGTMARRFNVMSEIGKQLDSLSDFVTFGIAPGIFFFISLTFTNQDIFDIPVYNISSFFYLFLSQKYIHIIFAFLVPFCAIYRLAKYNSEENHGNYFVGLPSTFSGTFIVLMYTFSFQKTLAGSIMKLFSINTPDFLHSFLHSISLLLLNYEVLFIIYVIVGSFMLVRIRYLRFNFFMKMILRNKMGYRIFFICLLFFFKYVVLLFSILYILHPIFVWKKENIYLNTGH